MKKGKMCDFCGEKKAMNIIPNPNATGENWWDVCSFCDDYIKEAQEKDFKRIMEYHRDKHEVCQEKSE